MDGSKLDRLIAEQEWLNRLGGPGARGVADLIKPLGAA